MDFVFLLGMLDKENKNRSDATIVCVYVCNTVVNTQSHNGASVATLHYKKITAM